MQFPERLSNQPGRIALFVLGLLGVTFQISASVSSPVDPVRYHVHIKPILSIHCYKCHDSQSQKGGYRLDIAEHALAGGKSELSAIVPGKSNESELYRRIVSQDQEDQMPPKGPRLTEEEKALIRQWIDEGADWPKRDEYWAFRPVKEPAVPNVLSNDVLLNPIDHFIAARLAAEKIEPVVQADARTLLRRAYADLIGLPTSPDEATLFLNDPSPDAYEKLIDRLLNDPRYGERWARHWLDLARYGESDGYEDDKIRPHAWRFRDYVIRSLNEDKPFDRFVREQIAGDELWPGEADSWVATGFGRLGAWDGMSKEPAQQRQDFLNDITDTVGSVFLGVTLGCARCHDHKYDDISQLDYYQIQAFFAGVKRETREFKEKLEQPAQVGLAFERDTQELGKIRKERESLLQKAREKLMHEQQGSGEGARNGRIDDAQVNKIVESLFPGQLAKLSGAIKEIENRRRIYAPIVDAVFAGENAPPKTFVLLGGELSHSSQEVKPGFLRALTSIQGNEENQVVDSALPTAGRRHVLADWIASPENPLTARVVVNRLWQHHFGAGIISTPSDFGRNGKQPTHPELLDWLARRFVADGYSLKKMHRLMMTSAAYRRSSTADSRAFSQDPKNQLLWRMNRRRLESEAIRDSILSVSGALQSSMGGPGVYARLPKGVNVELPNNDKELSWGRSTVEGDRRRSIYLFQRRSLTFPLMDVFDAAPMNQSCAVRAETTVAPQSLALFNGEFTREMAREFSLRLKLEAGNDMRSRIRRAFELAFIRAPAEAEEAESIRYLKEQAHRRGPEASNAEEPSWIDFCHVLLNSNELIYID